VARVKESVTAFERRTGARYAPPRPLRILGDPLRPRESCPTLFRFPGPEGLQAHFQGRLYRLAPPGLGHVWMTSRPTGAYPRPVELFGTLAVLEPLRLHACRTHCFTHTRDNWVGLERPVGADGVAWLPPSLVRRAVNLDRVCSAREARRRFGKRYEEERSAVEERLAAYLEELQELRRAGAPGPARHWCAVPARERRATLLSHGLTPRWTRL
jgi:hypothetical protein